MATFQAYGLQRRKITVQDSKLNKGFITITIESNDGSVFEPISLMANDANAFANALEHEAVNVHEIDLKQAVQHG